MRGVAALLRHLLAVVLVCLGTAQVAAEPALDNALRAAREVFNRAAPALSGTIMGVDTASYAAALLRQQTPDGALQFVIETNENGSCRKFAAYVGRVDGTADTFLFLCPQFFMPGADALRVTTILHELVHVVAGPDECRAMAYAAHLEMLANGRFQPVEAYWQRNGCASSRYRLP